MPHHDLPDLFRFDDGTRVRARAEWPRRREEIAKALVPIEYGELPARPRMPVGSELKRAPSSLVEGASFARGVVTLWETPLVTLGLELFLPPGDGPFPVIITGDGCWPMNDKNPREVLSRGVMLARFNREALVRDAVDAEGDVMDMRHAFPGNYGAIAAWAWGYHRAIDILLTLPEVNPAQIVVTGHSRGGKTALLAGATDGRIALVHANQSGCGGAGCFRWQGPKSETLADILKQFPHWFAPGLGDYIGREETLPFDQHSLKALVAPRPLLTTEALGDPWANPEGTWQSHQAAREVYRFLGAEDRLGIRFRHGPHDHALTDWIALLDFMEMQFAGKAPGKPFDASPFRDLPPGHAWHAPLH